VGLGEKGKVLPALYKFLDLFLKNADIGVYVL